MKKAQDFLVDTALGDKSFQVDQPKNEEKIVLSIEEGAVPVAFIKDVSRRTREGKKMSSFARFDESLRSLGAPKAKDKATFFRLMAIMINAGVPLIKSLDTVYEQTANHKFKNAIFDIARSVEKGATFSDSLALFPKIFSDAHVGMIRAAEASGQLNQILKQLAVEVEKSAAIMRKVRGALMYPAFIVIVMVGVVTAMMIFVVPKIAEIFLDSGQQLPLLTRIVIGISNFMQHQWEYLLGAVIALVAGFLAMRKTAGGRHSIDWTLVHLPLFGKLVRQSILARFARSLGNLLSSGVPITKGLLINARSLGNEVYRIRVELAAEDINQGIPLGESLRDSPEFPSMMVQMISVGEQTAQLDSIAGRIAEYYEEEVDVMVSGLSKLIEPIILVVLGGVVGGIIGAIMLPIIQLTQMAG